MKSSLAIAALLLLPLAAPSQEPAKASVQPDPVKWTILTAPKTAKPGGVFKVVLSVHIDEGWHLYTFKKAEGGPVPTSVSTAGPQSFKLVGSIDAPVGVTAFEERFGMEVEYYFGEVEIGVPMEVYRIVKPGKARLALEVQYQVCDNRQCLPSKKTTLESEIQIIQ